jgi:hypothetical protein
LDFVLGPQNRKASFGWLFCFCGELNKAVPVNVAATDCSANGRAIFNYARSQSCSDWRVIPLLFRLCVSAFSAPHPPQQKPRRPAPAGL